MIRLIFCFLLILFPLFGYAWQQNFNNAKKQLILLYRQYPQQKEFYCGCDFVFQGRKGIVDLNSCGYRVRKNPIRAQRIEWEHVMTAHHFGHQLQCWQKGGRKQCRRDGRFQQMEGDMHNLQPAIGEVNGDRSNYGYSLFTKTYQQYGQCPAATDFKHRQFQPRDGIRGMIARTYLYMSKHYDIRLSRQDTKLMHAWDTLYPPQRWECTRNQLIKRIQGNDNPFITSQCRLRAHG